MPEIQALTTRANELSGSVDWWNSAMIWALVFAAIAAIAVVLTTRVALVRAKQLGDVQGALIRAKDAQLTLDLRAKDEKISGLDLDSTEAKRGLAGLQKAASDAKAAQQRVEIELAKQQERAANAEQSLLELQEKVKSRHLSADQAATIKAFLLRAPPGSVDIEISLGAEDGSPFCKELAMAINAGGWKSTWGAQTAMYGQIRGTALIMKDVNSPPQSTATLQSALKSVDIEARGYTDHSLAKESLILLIAPKER